MTTKRLIYLMRHAKSGWGDPKLADFDRPLAPRGEQAGHTLAAHFTARRIEPALVLCSTAARTRQTLALVRSALPAAVDVQFRQEIYEASLATLLSTLRAVPDDVQSVMVIGHNPGIAMLASELPARGDPDLVAKLRARYPTGALTSLQLTATHWSDLSGQSCDLLAYVVPRELT